MTLPATTNYRTIPHHKVVGALPSQAQVLLSALYWHRNRDTGQLNPRHSTLARELHWSYWKVQAYMRMLREAGIVRAHKTQRGNCYEIRPTAEWKAPERGPFERICKPLKTPDGGDPAYAKTPRQDGSILYEQETSLLNSKSAAAAEGSTGGKGGDAAALASDKPKAPKPASAGSLKEAERIVTILAPVHPVAGNIWRAQMAIASLLESGAAAERILASHQQYRKLWAHYRPGRFIPQLWRWIEDGDWSYPPGDKEIAAARAERAQVKQAQEEIERDNREHAAGKSLWKEMQERAAAKFGRAAIYGRGA